MGPFLRGGRGKREGEKKTREEKRRRKGEGPGPQIFWSRTAPVLNKNKNNKKNVADIYRAGFATRRRYKEVTILCAAH